MKNIIPYQKRGRLLSCLLVSCLLCFCFISTAKAQLVLDPTMCWDDCFDRTTNVNGPGIYICASSTLPTCISCPAGCDSASGCVYYVIKNEDTCGKFYNYTTTIIGISVVVRKNGYSYKWKICRPQKNFASGCFSGAEYSIESDTLTHGATISADNCTNWVPQDSCQSDTINFVDPPHPPSFYSGTSCAPNPNDWNLYGGDEFSFILCGADDGNICCGVDFVLSFDIKKPDGTHVFCSRDYTCITSTSTACNDDCGH